MAVQLFWMWVHQQSVIFKNTQLAVADGEGSSVVWNSVNDFYFQPGATMQGAALLKNH